MLESAAMWNLHLIYRLSHALERFDDDAAVRALAGVTRAWPLPSSPPTPPRTSRFRRPMRRSWTPPSRPNSAFARRRRPQRHPGWWRQTVQLVDRIGRMWGVAPRRGSPPGCHQGRVMAAPRPHPIPPARVTPARLRGACAPATATTAMQELRFVWLAATALLLAL